MSDPDSLRIFVHEQERYDCKRKPPDSVTLCGDFNAQQTDLAVKANSLASVQAYPVV